MVLPGSRSQRHSASAIAAHVDFAMYKPATFRISSYQALNVKFHNHKVITPPFKGAPSKRLALIMCSAFRESTKSAIHTSTCASSHFNGPMRGSRLDKGAPGQRLTLQPVLHPMFNEYRKVSNTFNLIWADRTS